MTPAPISVDGAPAKVHRYDPRITPNLKTGRVDYDGMAAFPNGKWVLHSDYAALLQQLAERDADLEREQGVREDAQRQLRGALNDLHDMRWMYAQELKRAEAAERAREEAFLALREIAEYKGDPSAPAHNSVKKSAIARAFFAAVDTARAAAGEGER